MNIALVSDIHFGRFSRTMEFAVPGEPIEDETRGGPSLESGLIDLLKENNVKYLFVAGDLTSIGSPQEFHYCEPPLLKIANAAGIVPKNIVCCVGNHDIDRKISNLVNVAVGEEAQPIIGELVREKYQLLAANAASINLSVLSKLGDEKGPVPFCGVRLEEDFIVFLLNTSWQCSHDQSIPHGKLSINQLQWFENTAQKYRDDKRLKIVLMHHHPMQYSFPTPTHDVSMIEEGSELVEIAAKNGINLIMHGHRHHPRALTRLENGWQSPITFICAGSLSVNAKHRAFGEINNSVHIINIDNAPAEIMLYNYEFTLAAGWHPLEERQTTASMKKSMMLGRIVSPEEISGAIAQYSTGFHSLHYERLPDVLKYMDTDELIKNLREQLPNSKISGSFPDEVLIIPKEALR